MNRPKDKKFARELFEDTITAQAFGVSPVFTDEQRALYRDVEKLNREIALRRRNNEPAEEIQKYRDDEFLRLITEHHQANQARRERLLRDAERIKEAWSRRKARETTQDLLSLQRYQLRYDSMDKDKLRAAAVRLLEQGGSVDELAVVNARLHQLDADGIRLEGDSNDRAFWDVVQEKKLDQSWRQDNPAVFKALDVFNTEVGETKVLTENKELVSVSIQDLLEE